MIHVCFGLHDKTGRYSKFTGTAMLSLFENCNTPPSVTVHILHDNTLTSENRDKFSYVAGRYNQLVKFYNVEKLCAETVSEFIRLIPSAKSSWLTVAALYRLLIPQLLPAEIDKAIYLDSDIVVNLDIKELWQVELGNKPLAAAAELEIEHFTSKHNSITNYLATSGLVNSEDYFNSGVLFLNLQILREKCDIIMNGVKFVGEHPQLIYLDQEILNYLFSKDYLKLPVKFNFFVRESRYLSEPKAGKKIYHFTGGGFRMDMRDVFNRLWMHYFTQTPWFNEETIGRLYAGVQQLHVGFKQSMVNLTAIMSGKTCGFFVAPGDVDGLKRFFSIRNDEEIIAAENQDSLRKLLDAMNASRGKKLFFIMLPNFPFQILIQAGFAPGKEFVNGLDFFSEAQGFPLNSYPLVQAM